MQYNATTPSEYLASLENDWRKQKLLQLRKIIHAKAPGLKEGIEYKMLSYSDGQGSIFHLNAQKHHVGLYVGNASKIDQDSSFLKGLDVGKGCIRFKKLTELDEARISKFVERTMELRASGADIDC